MIHGIDGIVGWTRCILVRVKFGQLGEFRLRRINRIVVYVQLGARLLAQIGREHESIVCEGLNAVHVGLHARVLAEIGREHESKGDVIALVQHLDGCNRHDSGCKKVPRAR